ncbi:hypothetical protein SJI19_19610, partial [Acerihabitans sp. TG2]|uniref:hypothetical protein n=1 Tax=Acerihabitans sp. TG2 TaxID=3096008 RepID=UPI002B237765
MNKLQLIELSSNNSLAYETFSLALEPLIRVTGKFFSCPAYFVYHLGDITVRLISCWVIAVVLTGCVDNVAPVMTQQE